tara:strand:- start:359 stop:1120 length:762 start_codon:yes stop_codon:yes gene_type:complete
MNLKDLKKSSLLAEICGIHAGDGYLRNDGKRRELDISGNIEEKGYYDQHVIPLFENFFNIKIEGRYFPHRNTYGFVIRKKEIIEFMHKIGFPYGSKSLKVKILDFILKNNSLKKYFLRGYFDTDGCLSFGKRSMSSYSEFKKTRHYYPLISFSTVSKYLSKDLKIILKELNFKFYPSKYQPKRNLESLRYRIDLNGVKNLNKWLDEVCIANPTKYSRFLIWKKYCFCPPNTNYSQRLKILKNRLNPNLLYKGL